MALTTVPASLSATALTLTTAAQPNITSVGTLTGLTVSGNIAGTLTTAAQTNITSVGTLSSLTVSGALNGTLSTAAQTNITSLGTLTSLTVDDITINGSTISDGGTLTLDAAGELHLDADDGIIRVRDAGGDYGMFQISNSDFIIRSMVGDKDLIFKGNDGGSVITALTLDMSEAGRANFGNDISLVDSRALRLGTNDDTSIYHDGSHTYFRNSTSNQNMVFLVNDDGSANTELLRLSAGDRRAYFFVNSGNIAIKQGSHDSTNSVRLEAGGTTSTYLEYRGYLGHIWDVDTTRKMTLTANGLGIGTGIGANPVTTLDVESTAGNWISRFKNYDSNAYGVSIDVSGSSTSDVYAFAVYTPTQSGFFVNKRGKVGIGVTTPGALLHVKHAGGGFDEVARLTAVANSANDGAFLGFHGNSTSKFYGFIGGYDIDTNKGGVKIGVGNGETSIADSMTKMTIDNTGKVGIGTTTPGNNHAKANNLVVGSGSAGGMAVFNGTAEGWYAFSRSNANNTDAYDGGMSYTNRLMKFHTNAGSTRMAIDASGRVIIGGQSSHADGYSSAGGNSGENSHYAKLWIQGNTASTSGDGRLVLASGTAWPSTGTQIGSIWFSTSWGGDHAYIACKTRGGTGNSDYPGEIVFGTTADGASSPLERVRIDYNGKLLHSSTGSIDSAVIIDGQSRPYQQSDSKPGIVLRGTGTSSYSSCGSIYWGNAVSGSWGTGSYKHFHMYAHEENFHIANRNSRLTYFSQATNATWLYSSDERLKTDIEDIDLGLTVLNQLKPRKFKWKKDNTEDIGFIAQEVKPLVPIAIDGTGAAFEENEDEESGEYHAKILKIGNDKLIPVLVKAIQELSAEVEALKAKVGE